MSKKILVAEDSSVIQNLTKKILSIQNYQTTSVKNGNNVLKKMENEEFDLILMDINMPGMDGMQCAKAIRDSNNEVPIIAMTGNARNYTMEDFSEVGINDYLPKPLDYDAMVEMVKKYTSNAD